MLLKAFGRDSPWGVGPKPETQPLSICTGALGQVENSPTNRIISISMRPLPRAPFTGVLGQAEKNRLGS